MFAKLLLKLLGVKAENGAYITHPEVALRGGIDPIWIILLGVVLALAALWLYRREGESISAVRRWTMAVLRIAFLALILLLLLRPVLSFTMENTVRRGLVVVVDTSTSMGIKDPRSDAADQKRAAIAMGFLEPSQGLDQTLSADALSKVASVGRMDVLKALLQNKKLDLLARLGKEYDLKFYAFQDSTDGGNARITEPSTAPASQPATPSFAD